MTFISPENVLICLDDLDDPRKNQGFDGFLNDILKVLKGTGS